jgi:hypothetical protein
MERYTKFPQPQKGAVNGGLEAKVFCSAKGGFGPGRSHGTRRRRPVSGVDLSQRPLAEFICAENNQTLFDYHMPVADKPDF